MAIENCLKCVCMVHLSLREMSTGTAQVGALPSALVLASGPTPPVDDSSMKCSLCGMKALLQSLLLQLHGVLVAHKNDVSILTTMFGMGFTLSSRNQVAAVYARTGRTTELLGYLADERKSVAVPPMVVRLSD
jgi:hypothetical protein